MYIYIYAYIYIYYILYIYIFIYIHTWDVSLSLSLSCHMFHSSVFLKGSVAPRYNHRRQARVIVLGVRPRISLAVVIWKCKDYGFKIVIYGLSMVYLWSIYGLYMYNLWIIYGYALLVGGWPTPLKNMSQLGWWHSKYMGK